MAEVVEKCGHEIYVSNTRKVPYIHQSDDKDDPGNVVVVWSTSGPPGQCTTYNCLCILPSTCIGASANPKADIFALGGLRKDGSRLLPGASVIEFITVPSRTSRLLADFMCGH